MCVCLGDCSSNHLRTLENLKRQGNKVSKCDLCSADPRFAYRVIGVERIATREQRAKTINQPLCEAVKRQRVEAFGQILATTKLHTLAQVCASVDLESYRKNPLGIAAASSTKKVIRLLSEHLSFASARASGERKALLLFQDCQARIWFESEIACRGSVGLRDHSGSPASFILTASTSRFNVLGVEAFKSDSVNSLMACKCSAGLLPILNREW